ncbi:hypothetical protein OF83DRAFT_1062878, partial [Amylostereum chailletii]
VPLELLAEILSYLPSPKDVLAVTRTSKHLCATLLNKSNQAIWRRSRQHNNVGPIPEPPAGWSEPAFAAFIFDGGTCEVCKQSTKRMYVSYAIRARVCGNKKCRSEFNSNHIVVPPASEAKTFISKWMPSVEDSNGMVLRCLLKISFSDRKTDYLAAVDEYNRIIRLEGNYRQAHKRLMQAHLLAPLMKVPRSLAPLRRQYEQRYRIVRKQNYDIAKTFATQEGWEVADLLDTPTFNAIHRSRNNSLEILKHIEFAVIRSQVEADIIRLLETRKRREKEQGYRKRRDDISQHYRRMVSAGTVSMPNLTEFRNLPVLKVLQGKDTSVEEGIVYDLTKSNTMKDLLHGELKQWETAARENFATLLGFPGWTNPSTKVLHILDRVTARFVCKRCHQVPKKFAEECSFDFAGACIHECSNLNKKDRTKTRWSVEQFEPDAKGIHVISQALALAEVSSGDREAKQRMVKLGTRFLCKSCDGFIVMPFQRLAGHSKRHEEMTIALLSEADAASILTLPLRVGRCHELMQGMTKQAKQARLSKTFGCRHCIQRPLSATVGVVSGVNAGAPSSRGPTIPCGSGSKAKLVSFDGMISHVKAKWVVFDLPVCRPINNVQTGMESSELAMRIIMRLSTEQRLRHDADLQRIYHK